MAKTESKSPTAANGASNTPRSRAADNTKSKQRPVARPPARQRTIFSWLLLLCVLLLAAAPLLIDLQQPDVILEREGQTLVTSIETWQKLSLATQDPRFVYDRWEPRRNGIHRLDLPPATAWIHKAAFEGFATRKPAQMKVAGNVAAGKLQTDALGEFDLADIELPELLSRMQRRAAHRQLLDRPRASVSTVNGLTGVQFTVEQLHDNDRLVIHLDGLDAGWRQAVDTYELTSLARLTNVVAAMVLLAAIFWAGHTLGGLPTAVYAALIVAGNPMFILASRFATPDVFHALWASVAVAAALWAIRPLRPASSVVRQFLGWVTCGLALGLGLLTTGGATLWWALPPIVFVLCIAPERFGHLMGLLAAMLIGMLLSMPWLIHVYQQSPEAWQLWLHSLAPLSMQQLDATDMFRRLGFLLLIMAPWTIWMVVAIFQPISSSSTGRRRRLLLGLAWGLGMTLLFMVWPVEQLAEGSMPILPAAAIVVAILFTHFSELASEGRYTRAWRWLRWAHLAVVVVLSIALPIALAREELFRPWLPVSDTVFQSWRWFEALGLCVVLLGIAGLSVRYVWGQFPAKALVVWSIWSAVAIGVIVLPLSRGELMQNPADREEGRRIAQLTADEKAYWVGTGDRPEPDPIVLLYAGRPIPVISADKIDEAANELDQFYLVTPVSAARPSPHVRAVAVTGRGNFKVWVGPVDQTTAGVSR